MLGNKLRRRISDVDTSFPLQKSHAVFSHDEQLINSAVTKNQTVVCNTGFIVGNHSRLVSSQHLPLHEVTISTADRIPFTLRQESVLWQIVCSGNVEFFPHVVVLIEPVSSEGLSCFLPGDQLIAINDAIIESKDEAWHALAECKLDTLKLLVRPLAELSELSLRYIHYQGDEGPRQVSRLNSRQQHITQVSVSLYYFSGRSRFGEGDSLFPFPSFPFSFPLLSLFLLSPVPSHSLLFPSLFSSPPLSFPFPSLLMRGGAPTAKAIVAYLKHGNRIWWQGFRYLLCGTKCPLQSLNYAVVHDCYRYEILPTEAVEIRGQKGGSGATQ